MKLQMDAEALNLLKRAGLNEYESRVYLGLLNHGTATASDISEVASIPRPRTYDVLVKLEKKGFVSVQPGRPTKFSASVVSDAFKSLKEYRTKNHLKKLNDLKDVEKKLRKRATLVTVEEEGKEELWMLSNHINIKTKVESLIENAQDSIILAGDEKRINKKLGMYGDSLIKAKDRGVKVKIISSVEMEHDFIHKKAETHRMLIADDNVLFFLNDGANPKQDRGAWIKSGFVAQNLRKML